MRVIISSKEVQRDVYFIAHHPAVMAGSDVEEISGLHLDDAAVVHCGRGSAGQHQADVFHRAAADAQRLADVNRPSPPRFIAGAADGHAPDANDLELALLEGANLVRLLESFQDHV